MAGYAQGASLETQTVRIVKCIATCEIVAGGEPSNRFYGEVEQLLRGIGVSAATRPVGCVGSCSNRVTSLVMLGGDISAIKGITDQNAGALAHYVAQSAQQGAWAEVPQELRPHVVPKASQYATFFQG